MLQIAWERYSSWAKAAPYTCAFATCFVKGSIADTMCQLFVEQRGTIDIARNFGFSTFSALFTGIVQQFLYTGGVGHAALFSRIFGDAPTLQVALKKGVLDLCTHATFVQNPAAYICTNLFTGQEPMAGLYKYFEPGEFIRCTASYTVVWIPAQLAMFTVVPAHLRVSFAAAVSVCWQTFLSSIAYCQPAPVAAEPSPSRLGLKGW